MEHKQATRIQTSLLNTAEKKLLVWLAERQPRWVTSDLLTFIGFLGALTIAAGYILSSRNINFLWIASLGFVINWYGDSLDGTLARVRGTQRPVYGYYLDHTMDGINESLIFVGMGLSSLMHLSLALGILLLYQLMTVNVSINAHLRSEFRLTYAKMGPTEFRLLGIIVNTLFIFIPALPAYSRPCRLFGYDFMLSALDGVAIGVIVLLALIFTATVISDARYYSKIDPKK